MVVGRAMGQLTHSEFCGETSFAAMARPVVVRPPLRTDEPPNWWGIHCSVFALGLNGTVNNTEAQAAQGGPLASRLRWDLFLFCGSQDSAYYRTYRRQLRPSSRHEPRHPPWQALPSHKTLLLEEAPSPLWGSSGDHPPRSLLTDLLLACLPEDKNIMLSPARDTPPTMPVDARH